jgi:hypothetical protein
MMAEMTVDWTADWMVGLKVDWSAVTRVDHLDNYLAQRKDFHLADQMAPQWAEQ